MFKNLFKRCKHEYKRVGFVKTYKEIDGELCYAPCTFLECKHCGKREVLKESDIHYYQFFLDSIKLWKKKQIKIDFKAAELFQGVPANTKAKQENPGVNPKAVKLVEDLGKELRKLSIEMWDTENRLIINNARNMINDLLDALGLQ